MKRHIISLILILVTVPGFCQRNIDTLKVSDIFTTHIIFNTDVIYADLSNSQVTAAKILEQSRNIMALKARSAFDTPFSVSALESNGTMHTFIVKYEKSPAALIYDRRPADIIEIEESQDSTSVRSKTKKKTVKKKTDKGAGMFRKNDAPLLKDVTKAKQMIWHISQTQYDIDISCINIITYSDITFMVFELRNKSGVSYECNDATFVIESKKRSKKTVVYDQNLFHKSRYGTLSCAPKETSRIGYSLDKLSLSKDQVLKVYFYEKGGQRELVLTINSDDINKAKTNIR